jgi:hypothetical protein
MELARKSVLVTGASSGIGKAIAIAFAQKHARVLVHYGKNKSGGRETLDEVEKFSNGRLYQADLMNRDQIRALFKEVKQTNQTIDVLVNNAGDARAGDIQDDQVWEYEYKNIFLSAMRVTEEFLALPSPNLRKNNQRYVDLWKSPHRRPGIPTVFRLQSGTCQCDNDAQQDDCSKRHRQCGCARLYRHAGLGGCFKGEQRGMCAGHIDRTFRPGRRSRARGYLYCRKRCLGRTSAHP